MLATARYRSAVLALALALTLVPAACAGRTRPQPGPAQATSAASGSVTPPTAALSGSPCGSTASPPATYQHVIWIWMENHTWPEVLGDRSGARYESSLARQCGTATRYASVGSPSLPNYIGATSGATQGIADDASPPSHRLTVDNLFRQVRAAGGSERTFAEDMATNCQLVGAGGYAVKHNPAAYYTGADDRPACQADDVGLAAFDAGHLPTFSFIVPNLCHSTHDCGVASGDAWLAQVLPPVLASPTYRAGATAVFVIWDEETPMPNLVISPTVAAGSVIATHMDHYTLLRTTEEMLGLPGRLGAAASAPSVRGAFHL